MLPASTADDRELPAVPSAQGLALWRPLHELHQGGESYTPQRILLPATSSAQTVDRGRAGALRFGAQTEAVSAAYRLGQVTSHLCG